MDKRFEKILVCGMLCAALALPFLYNADSYAQINDGLIGPDGIINQYPGIMRLHIIANSDSEKDQELKLAVRNYILSKVQNELDNKEEARTYVLENLQRIEEWAQVAVDAAGFEYDVRADVNIRHIPAKYYSDLFFPEGNYEALTITLGEGKGQNWWCVVFPPLCLVDNTVPVDSAELESGDGEVLVLKSRIVEILEESGDSYRIDGSIVDVIKHITSANPNE
ncbi:MAG: stage II sporulation protein R [Firmicutes bacterium]|nr:stage II sporulation protein R [Bacillota bacterium]